MLQWLRLYTLGSRGSRELKTFLEIRLISSRIDQKLRRKEEYIGFYKGISARNVGRPFRDEVHPSDEANSRGSWPTTLSTISFKESRPIEIGHSTRLLDLAIVSHDLAIVAYPPSDSRHHVEVSPHASFSIGFHHSRLIAIICLF